MRPISLITLILNVVALVSARLPVALFAVCLAALVLFAAIEWRRLWRPRAVVRQSAQ